GRPITIIETGARVPHERILRGLVKQEAIKSDTTGRPETIVCADCPTVVRVKRQGVVPKRCKDCTKKKCERERVYPSKAKPGRPTEIKCIDCPAIVKVNPIGAIPKRCRPCRLSLPQRQAHRDR